VRHNQFVQRDIPDEPTCHRSSHRRFSSLEYYGCSSKRIFSYKTTVSFSIKLDDFQASGGAEPVNGY